jgi:hypothetical protein
MRRRQEVASEAATTRPRGHGGRFLRNGESIKGAFDFPEMSPSPLISPDDMSRREGLGSITPILSAQEQKEFLESGRPKRNRRPTARYASSAPSTASNYNAKDTSKCGSRELKDKTTILFPTPGSAPRKPLTIRIPPLSVLKGRRSVSESENTSALSLSSRDPMSQTPTESNFTGFGTPATVDTVLDERWSGHFTHTPDMASVQAHNEGYREPDMTSSHTYPLVKHEDNLYGDHMDIDLSDWDFRSRLDECNARPTATIFPDGEGGGHSKQDEMNMAMLSFNGHLSPSSCLSQPDTSSELQMRRAVTGCDSIASPAYSSPTTGLGPQCSAISSSANGTFVPIQVSFSSASSGSRTKEWTVEEQRQLDALLIRYPDGTRSRCVQRMINCIR